VLVVVNEMKIAALMEKLPGYGSPLKLDGVNAAGEPARLVLQLEPGNYEIAYTSDAGGNALAIPIGAGEQKMVEIFQHRGPKEVERYWYLVPTEKSDVYASRFDVPYGCPGGLPPTPTPPPQCPAWYATPAPGKAVLAIENRSTEAFDLLDPNIGRIVAKVPRNANELPGFVAISLSPGHYEFQTSTSKRVVVDLAAGTSAVAVHPETRWGPDLLQVFGLTPPAACPGYTAPTPTPAPQCPDWFQRPQPGKGILVIENWIMVRVVTVVATKGLELEIQLQPYKGDFVDRRVLQLNPGHYEFATQEGGFSADITEGQTNSVGLAQNPWGKRTATVMVSPPGCQ
jgi:hypothetical protein